MTSSTPVSIGRRRNEPPRVAPVPHVHRTPIPAWRRSARLGRFVAATWAKRLRPDLHIRPIAAELFLTDNCNLKCISCTCWHENTLGELDESEWCSVVDQLAALDFMKANFTGGEALIRRDAARIIAHAREAGISDLHLNTNGIVLDDDRIDEVLEAGVRSFNISIDGPDPESHDAIRGRDGAFEITVDALERLLARQHKTDIAVRMNFTVLRTNAEHLPAMADLAQRLGVDLYLNLGTDTTFLFRDQGISDLTKVDGDTLTAALAGFNERRQRNPEHLPNALDLDYIPGHFGLEPTIDVPCVESQLKLMVRSTGSTGGCWGHDATMNVRTTPIAEIIDSPAYREEQARLFRKDCVQCGSNYSVNLRTQPNTLVPMVARSLRDRAGRTARERGRS